ncbi:hypothetical protein TNCT_571421 [Trichonephila clavata]|uniref:RING-type domain-containing protein n=1 Tax=Trichonephila clavata TaxID=2740835 RepID=A0A8X6KWQ5_TRICU|nr:hypothetical protein TNCT_571421 [Trichonephila clavata]
MHCLVCYCSLSSSGGAVAIQCGHVFHQHCLLPHIKQSQTCPLCHEPTSVKSIIMLDFYNVCDEDYDEEEEMYWNEGILEQLALVRKEKLLALKKKVKLFQSCVNNMSYIVNEIFINKLEPDVFTTLKEQNFSSLESDLHKLKTENNGLREEIEHLKNVKTIVTSVRYYAENTLSSLLDVVPKGHEFGISLNLANSCMLYKRMLVKHEMLSRYLRNEISNYHDKLKLATASFDSSNNKTNLYENEMKKLKLIENTLLAQIDSRNNSNASNSDNSAFSICEADSASCDVCSLKKKPLPIKGTGSHPRDIEIMLVPKDEESIEVSSASALPISGEIISAKKTRAYQHYFTHSAQFKDRILISCKKENFPLVKVT